ncbi:MAG: transcriptional regulator, TraR/DksA family, partial [Proteobacteria bacterium]|nr:transcriptional regulator, TraR/DksA family [Pseudomonadota bacterium]
MTVELTEHQINGFKKRLNDRFAEVRREIAAELLSADEEQYGELAGRVHDFGDESLADLLVDLELASIDRHIQEIRDIDAALMRIAQGGYGECSDCGEA